MRLSSWGVFIYLLVLVIKVLQAGRDHAGGCQPAVRFTKGQHAFTVSTNQAWGGTIPFPKEEWNSWYDYWIVKHEGKRYYRYLRDNAGHFIGELAYHYDNDRKLYIADIIVYAPYRKKGYGSIGLGLLCNAAKQNGVKLLYDDLAIDNPAITMFLQNGFREEYRTHKFIMLKKEL